MPITDIDREIQHTGPKPPHDSDMVCFGRTNFRGDNRLFGIKRKDRRQHMYVIGKTGTGKSSMLHNIIIQDIMNNEGICVVDPHGELIEDILGMIPRSRKEDVIYFNPADMDYHVGFNPLELPDPRYKHLVASGLMGIFTKIWANVWSARMEYILNNAILALLDTPGTTLLGASRILVDKDYRQRIIDNVEDPVVKAFWINEYEEWQDKFRNEAIAPIQNKIGQFLSTALVRNIVGQSKSTIDIFKLMNEKKIFLVNVSKGRIGEDNSRLLGAMIITKIQLAAMERVRIKENEREDFYLYVDEFQNFATDSFASVLSEARKYRLNLIIAHQYVGQLVDDQSTKVRDAVFGNTGTIITFRVGASDAEFLEPEFTPEFEIQDIVNLPNYSVYIRLMVDGLTTRPFSASTIAPFMHCDDAVPEDELVATSRDKYGQPKAKVEADIKRWASGNGFEDIEEIESGKARIINGDPGDVTVDGKKKLSGDDRFSMPCDVPGCGKTAKLPFKPDPNKPVYCSDCFEKLQNNEIEPVKILRQASEDKNAKAQAELAMIGIEFRKEEVAPAKQRGKRKRGKRKRRQDVGSRVPFDNAQGKQDVEGKTEGKGEAKEVSLGDLANKKEDVLRRSSAQVGSRNQDVGREEESQKPADSAGKDKEDLKNILGIE
ncbi:MAG: type IV secretion system DNA-binding domain-containing protein [bacterium]|nr:type IV secretion system DNA-binding domain-containing protein [bacterium]